MSQNLAEASIVRFVVQQAFHTIDFGVDLVAIRGQHRQTGTWINEIGPVALFSNFHA